MKGKTYLVAWSGGLDSTYLIHKLLSEGHTVEAVYVAVTNNKDKSAKEQEAIGKLLPLFETLGGGSAGRFYYRGVACTVGVDLWAGTGLCQPTVWLMALAMSCRLETNAVAIGYICNDDAVSYLKDMQSVWRGMMALRTQKIGGGPRIEFPLVTFSKNDICDLLPGAFAEKCVFCEKGEKEPCGDCYPCQKWKFLVSTGRLNRRWVLDGGREEPRPESAMMLQEVVEGGPEPSVSPGLEPAAETDPEEISASCKDFS